MDCVIKQTNGTTAVAVATPAGLVTGEQLAKIAELVKQGAGLAKFTTGQRIVILTGADQVQAVRDGLAEVGLSIGPVEKPYAM
jgi:dissimilatory sulfite reductase (desulfoviridin) alpha/beta subunit